MSTYGIASDMLRNLKKVKSKYGTNLHRQANKASTLSSTSTGFSGLEASASICKPQLPMPTLLCCVARLNEWTLFWASHSSCNYFTLSGYNTLMIPTVHVLILEALIKTAR